MPQIIIRHSETEREVLYDADEEKVPNDVLYTVVHMMPAEIARIQEAKSEDVQNILRRYI